MKRFCFDIDGTICQDTFGNYQKSVPNKQRIKLINSLYDKGNHIIYLTARGMGSSQGDVKKAYKKYYDFTYDQLIKWECKFHDLYLGKPNADIYIDNNGIDDISFFNSKEYLL